MNNILLIIQREYLTRVKKKSFIVMTILGPVLIAAMYGIVIWSAMSSISQKSVQVLDESQLFVDKFPASETFIYEFISGDLDSAKTAFKGSGKDALVFIPKSILINPKDVKIFSEEGVPFDLQNGIENAIEREIESIKLTEAGITRRVLEDAKMNVESQTISLKDDSEEKSSAAAASIIGIASAFLIYISVFIYGAQVMRGVMEEKTSRIVEVIISSVRPFQLMIGKIVGIGLVGLTQFLLWIVLSFVIFNGGLYFMQDKVMDAAQTMSQSQMEQMSPEERQIVEEQIAGASATNGVSKALGALETLPVATIIICFIIYFLGGYLLYSALFGAVGSAVDSETDTQQFMFPITIPIIASIIFAQFVMKDPNGTLAFWTSMIPFTSPIIMMVRIPFGVPLWELALSISLLIAGFMLTTWIAARIYRVGILMYGKKTSWKELAKWVFYKG
ncbi:MAG: ABC transporter permease [Spirosomaceae bacterium]|nr:ABC transporter permease [Spirosomataceae bacterium]